MKPDERISASSLCRLYKAYSIRRKVITKPKVIPYGKKVFSNKQVLFCKRRLAELTAAGVPVIFADEGMITKHTVPTHEYAPKYCNVEMTDKQRNIKSLAFIVALSSDKGFVHSLTRPKSIVKEVFKEFLEGLREIYKDSE